MVEELVRELDKISAELEHVSARSAEAVDDALRRRAELIALVSRADTACFTAGHLLTLRAALKNGDAAITKLESFRSEAASEHHRIAQLRSSAWTPPHSTLLLSA